MVGLLSSLRKDAGHGLDLERISDRSSYTVTAKVVRQAKVGNASSFVSSHDGHLLTARVGMGDSTSLAVSRHFVSGEETIENR